MTLLELLRAIQNQNYRQNHSYNIPTKLFENYINKVEFVDIKSKSYMQVLMSNKPVALKRFNLADIEVEEKGYWVAEFQDDWLILLNCVSRFQAEQTIKDKDAFIVKTDIPKNRMTAKEYNKGLVEQTRTIKIAYLMSYPEDEGCVRNKEIVKVLNDFLRGETKIIKKTRLYNEQPKSYERVISVIKEFQTQGQLKEYERYIERRTKNAKNKS